MAPHFGAFGKMPSLGDFLRMDLAAGFIDPWDRWLQDGLTAARASLGDRWQDCYFSAPIWRFHLAPGLAGAAAAMGVMMSSVDRVGRQFPLTLAAPLPDGSDALLSHFSATAAFAAAEDVALAALEDDFTREALKDRLTRIVPPATPRGVAIHVAQGGLVVTGAAPGALVPELAATALARQFRAPSLWSAETPVGMRMMVCEGLPAGGQMTGLFDMQAQVWQCTEDA